METLSAAQPSVKQITATVEVSLKMIVEAATEAIWPEVPAYGGSTMTSPARAAGLLRAATAPSRSSSWTSERTGVTRPASGAIRTG
jgi:hypothetical protein